MVVIAAPSSAPVGSPSPSVASVVSGSGAHDLFDVVSSIVIPSVTGGAAVAVSLASLLVALGARRIAARAGDLETRRRNEEMRERRVDLALLLWEQFRAHLGTHLNNGTTPSGAEHRWTEARSDDLARRLLVSGDTSAEKLAEWLRIFKDHVRKSHRRQAEYEAWGVIMNWVDDPEAANAWLDEEQEQRRKAAEEKRSRQPTS